MQLLRAAVFLDRDGVLIEDRGLLVDPAGIRILPGVPAALRKLKEAGFFLAVVSNQAVVARGLISPRDLDALNTRIRGLLEAAGAPPLDAAYFCPHHPEAALPRYRVVCDCRKPRPGSLLRAAREYGLDLAASFMVGDRMTDIAAGTAAGCRTVLLETGQHDAPPIVTALTQGALTPCPSPADHCYAMVPDLRSVPGGEEGCRPNHTCADLPAAAEWILGER
jgi:D-glycero-D-manno-heptose 1,7-bisphosphate phosphatase